MLVTAGAAHVDMASQRRGPTHLDGRKRTALRGAEQTLDFEPWALSAHDVRDVEAWPPESGRWLHVESADLGEPLDRTSCLGDQLGRDAEVTRGRLDVRVTQQHLNDSQVGAALEQMGRKTVTQHVRRHISIDPSLVRSVLEGLASSAGDNMLALVTTTRE